MRSRWEISPWGKASPPSRTSRWDRSHNHDQKISQPEKSSPPERLLTLVEPNVADSVDVTPGMTPKKQAELVAKRLRAAADFSVATVDRSAAAPALAGARAHAVMLPTWNAPRRRLARRRTTRLTPFTQRVPRRRPVRRDLRCSVRSPHTVVNRLAPGLVRRGEPAPQRFSPSTAPPVGGGHRTMNRDFVAITAANSRTGPRRRSTRPSENRLAASMVPQGRGMAIMTGTLVPHVQGIGTPRPVWLLSTSQRALRGTFDRITRIDSNVSSTAHGVSLAKHRVR